MNHFIGKENAIHTFSREHTPVCRAKSGERLVFETYDCYMGQLLEDGSSFAAMDRTLGNPAAGPVYIEEARPGDMLKVEIESIVLDPVGILDKGPSSGALKAYFPEYTIKRLKVRDGYILYEDKKIPAHPMIGVIGTAPAGKPEGTMWPGDHGGNMDCTRIAEGSVLYLPVSVPGALLAMGDFHAIMGDGECGNCGVEIGGRATVRVSVLKSVSLTWPLVETAGEWCVVASAYTVDQACQRAVDQMYSFLTVHSGLCPVDAGMYIDMFGNMIVCQMVNPLKTVRLEMNKELLRSGGFHGLGGQV